MTIFRIKFNYSTKPSFIYIVETYDLQRAIRTLFKVFGEKISYEVI